MRTLVLIPTYNERENLPLIVARTRAAVPEADILVLDDNSPDGTGAVADELAAADSAVHVVHRTTKSGLGDAYLAGFAWGREHGYDALVEMDADGSHRPEELPRLLGRLADDDVSVVIGSRWTPGGRVENWPLHRKALSVGGNAYVRVMLGMPVSDATAGFRVYRTSALEAMDLRDLDSHGYAFQTDLTWRAIKAGLLVVEVPITFVERTIGASKMSGHIMRESMANVTRWGIGYRSDQARRALTALRGGALERSTRYGRDDD